MCGYSNRPPSLANPGTLAAQVSQPVTLQLEGVDPDGQPVTYSATGLPAGLTLQSSTGFVSGTPTAAGSFTVNATVSDGQNTITVTARDAAGNTGPTSSS